ncbi:uncharacterized protein TNCV_1970581 [Trichonephila clavipes]|uniref:Uncharacterized protein n=1 Tax=Trichonephila clavipes TaxID=2585209 RepID=A0A8X6W4Y8_TRICX|nr:uncharacterized protein TNCV_1970581 [Trichonephila clavipes]
MDKFISNVHGELMIPMVSQLGLYNDCMEKIEVWKKKGYKAKDLKKKLDSLESSLNRDEAKIAKGLGLNPGEDIDVCKCIVPSWHGSTLNSRRAPSLLVRLVEEEERWEASDHPKSVLPLNWGGTKPNRTVSCMVLKATANDRRHLALGHDEFRGPRSGLC